MWLGLARLSPYACDQLHEHHRLLFFVHYAASETDSTDSFVLHDRKKHVSACHAVLVSFARDLSQKLLPEEEALILTINEQDSLNLKLKTTEGKNVVLLYCISAGRTMSFMLLCKDKLSFF